MVEKKEVVGLAVIKAIITTGFIGLAINRLIEVSSTTDYITMILTVGFIGIVSVVGSGIYSHELFKKGILKTPVQFFHTYGINWEDNAGLLLKSWGESGVIGLLLVVSYLLSTEGQVGIYPIAIAIGFGVLTVYIMRKDCKTPMQYIKFFIYGYLFGIGMVIAGVLIQFLISIFGAFWIGLLIGIDVLFTGAYTYLDLLEWEREQNKNIEDAKISAGLK
jgi:hypothetical protein